MDCVFVILHYVALKETIECVESILKNCRGNYRIIIVDNASPNESGAMLSKRYDDSSNVDVIISRNNLGFAKGNNLGYKYAVERYNPDYIICMNNDTLIEDENFIQSIKSLYEKTHFDVLGPDIIAGNGKIHQNPAHYASFSSIRLRLLLANKKYYLESLKPDIESKNWARIKYRISGRIYRIYSTLCETRAKKQGGLILHGACLIFSRNYISRFQDAFCPDTFLYLEEDILEALCKKNNMKLVYSSDLRIFHLEDVATNLVHRDSTEKEMFKTSQFIKSGEVLLKIIER